MSHRVLSRCFALTTACLALILPISIGCNQTDPIVTYQVPTKVPDQLLPGKDRMLAAMMPQGDQVWFFKVKGPEDAVEMVESEFRSFVENIKFKAGKPDLTVLPEGWRRGGEKQFRFASIDATVQGKGMETGKQLDISVSSLSKQDDWDAYVAMNVNRWRDQLGLESSDDKWAGGDPMEIATADGESVWFDQLGDPAKANSSKSPPFASGGPFASGTMANQVPATQVPKTSTAPKAESRVKYDTPDGWRPGKMSMMRLAAFYVGPKDEGSRAEVTVMQAGGDLRANVARWIGQIRTDKVPDTDVDQALEDAITVEVAGRESKRYILTGNDSDTGNAIDATIVPLEGGFSMFIKMTGPASTVKDQGESMAKFLETLQF